MNHRRGRRQQWWLYNRRITGPALLVAVAFGWCLVVVSMAAVLLVAELSYPP